MNIVEQPTNRIRYRYRSEKGSHGGLNGENSSQIKKTYPTIKVYRSIDSYNNIKSTFIYEYFRLKIIDNHCQFIFVPVWQRMKTNQGPMSIS